MKINEDELQKQDIMNHQKLESAIIKKQNKQKIFEKIKNK